MSATNFNFFKVLDKDNKELVHSAFLKYLMQYDDTFYTKFLKVDFTFSEPKLEKLYTLAKKVKGRFDIEVTSEDNSTLLVIENKFKSFPYENQVLLYDKIISEYHKEKTAIKLLICFDKRFAGNYPGWLMRDYSDLLSFLKEYYPMDNRDDHSVFIRHYYNALSDYYQEYRRLQPDFRELLLNRCGEANNFWLRLFYSALKIRLESYMDDKGLEAVVYVNSGNTTVPLLDFIPKDWNIKGNKLLIQLQGNDIKFYSHSTNQSFLSDLKRFSQDQFSHLSYEYKKETKRQSNTQYILKAKLLSDSKAMNVNYLFDRFLEFYSTLNEKVIQKYETIIPLM